MRNRIPSDAFDFYVGLGVDRSYQTVADHFGVTKRAITKVASREEWSTRLRKIEKDAREEGDKKLGETMEDIRGRHLRTLKAMHARSLTALKQYPLTSGMEAMRAAEMVIKLERLITGEATSRSELSIEEVTRREIQSFLELVEDDNEPDKESKSA